MTRFATLAAVMIAGLCVTHSRANDAQTETNNVVRSNTNFPGGNAAVAKVEGDRVDFAPDLRGDRP